MLQTCVRSSLQLQYWPKFYQAEGLACSLSNTTSPARTHLCLAVLKSLNRCIWVLNLTFHEVISLLVSSGLGNPSSAGKTFFSSPNWTYTIFNSIKRVSIGNVEGDNNEDERILIEERDFSVGKKPRAKVFATYLPLSRKNHRLM